MKKTVKAAAPQASLGNRRTTETQMAQFGYLVRRMGREYGDVLRIGQMILNATAAKGDLYYLENDQIIAALEADLAGNEAPQAPKKSNRKAQP